MSQIIATPPTAVQNNNVILTSPAPEFLQVVGDHLVFEPQQQNPGVFVGNLH